jgi:hypothetical protein
VSALLTALKVLSLLVAAAGLVLLLRSPTRRFQGLFWIALGCGLALVAYQPALWSRTTLTATTLKMRMATGVVSFMVLMITLEAVRRTAMIERYALLWVFTGLLVFVVAVYPDAVQWLARITGMHYTSAVMVVVFTFMLLVAFDFSIALSRHQEKQKQMAQRIALLEKRLEQVELPAGETPPEVKSP